MRQRCIRPLAILEWMDIDKAKRGRRRFQHRVQLIFAHSIIRFQQSSHEVAQIFRPGADEFRKRVAVVVPFSEENTMWTEASRDESRVFNKDTLKANDFVEGEWALTGLQNCATSSLQPVPGGRSPSISKLARLSANSKKLAARATRWATVRPTFSRALPERSSATNSRTLQERQCAESPGRNGPFPGGYRERGAVSRGVACP
jgi:hypothetical protein